MKSRITTAVILAAGLGNRLGDLKRGKPKAFLEIGNETLIERSIRLLLAKGITKIIIGTGYGSDFFEALRQSYPEVETYKNPKFDKTGSMYTLFLLRELVTGPFLLLEGDLLYESEALRCLLEDDLDDLILASDPTHSGDEVFIECFENGTLANMSKNREALRHADGELVGISKLSLGAYDKMMKLAALRYDRNEYSIHYEDALVGIAQDTNLHVKISKGLAWCEIDDASHWERAISTILPRIKEKESINNEATN